MAAITELQLGLQQIEPFRLRGVLRKKSGAFPYSTHDRTFVIAAQFLYEFESSSVRAWRSWESEGAGEWMAGCAREPGRGGERRLAKARGCCGPRRAGLKAEEDFPAR
jgi:hypothetical protein